MTKLVLGRYLEDFRAALERDHVLRWKSGRLEPDHESEAKGRINTLEEIAGLQFEHMLMFYGDDTSERSSDEQDE